MADKSQDLGVAEKSYSISFANMEGRKFYFGTIINLGIVLGNKKYFLDGDGTLTLSVSPKRGGKGCRKRREQNRAVTKQTGTTPYDHGGVTAPSRADSPDSVSLPKRKQATPSAGGSLRRNKLGGTYWKRDPPPVPIQINRPLPPPPPEEREKEEDITFERSKSEWELLEMKYRNKIRKKFGMKQYSTAHSARSLTPSVSVPEREVELPYMCTPQPPAASLRTFGHLPDIPARGQRKIPPLPPPSPPPSSPPPPPPPPSKEDNADEGNSFANIVELVRNKNEEANNFQSLRGLRKQQDTRHLTFCPGCLTYTDKIHFCPRLEKWFNIDRHNHFYIEGETESDVRASSEGYTRQGKLRSFGNNFSLNKDLAERRECREGIELAIKLATTWEADFEIFVQSADILKEIRRKFCYKESQSCWDFKMERDKCELREDQFHLADAWSRQYERYEARMEKIKMWRSKHHEKAICMIMENHGMTRPEWVFENPCILLNEIGTMKQKAKEKEEKEEKKKEEEEKKNSIGEEEKEDEK